MKLLQVCAAAAIAAGVAAAPHVARAQALGEAATLSAGVSSAGSASGSSLGSTIGRAMGSEGSRVSSSGKASTSGGVINLHWSRADVERSERSARTRAKDKTTTGSRKAHPDFVVFGADPQNADPDADPDAGPDASPDHTPVSQPKPANSKAPSGQATPKK